MKERESSVSLTAVPTLASSVRSGAAPTSNDSLDGLLKVFLVDGVREMASSDQSRLVANVGNVGAWQDESKEKEAAEPEQRRDCGASLDRSGATHPRIRE